MIASINAKQVEKIYKVKLKADRFKKCLPFFSVDTTKRCRVTFPLSAEKFVKIRRIRAVLVNFQDKKIVSGNK